MSIKSLFNQADKVIDRLESDLQKQLLNEYSKSLEQLKREMATVYAEYSKDGILTYAEMQKYNRYKRLESSLNKIISDLMGNNKGLINKAVLQAYKEQYYRTSYALEIESQNKLGYRTLKADQVKKDTESPFKDASYENIHYDLRRRIRQDLLVGLVTQQGYKKVTNAFKTSMGKNYSSTKRTADVETFKAESRGRQASYEHAKKEGLRMIKVWVSTLDDRTRPWHRALDGVKKKVDEVFTSPHTGATALQPRMFGNIEDDAYCRCRTVVEFEGYPTEQAYRRARGVDGKNRVIKYKTFEEWYKNRVRS